MIVENPTLSNLQLELLKLYSDNVSETDLKEIKNLIANYFSKKLINQADKIWEEKGFNEDEMLNSHFRTQNLFPNQ